MDPRPLPVSRPILPVASNVGCTNCRVPTTRSSINFNGYSAKTPAFCNKCFSAILGCWPTPNFSYAGCGPTIAGGTTPLDPLTGRKPIDDQALINQLGWVQCVASNTFKRFASSIGHTTCAHGVYECLKGITEKKRHTRNIDTITLNLVEAMLPVMQNMELGIEVLGDEVWLSVGDPLWLSNVLQPTLDDGSESGVLISTTELSTILAAPPPNGTTAEMVQRLAKRLNNTLHSWNSGHLEPVEGANMASYSKVQGLNENITAFNDKAVAKGFSSFLDAYNFASGEVNKLDSWEDEAGVCAVVRIRVEQELAVTRTAFLAKLEIENMDNSPLKDGSLQINIFDSVVKVNATHLFAIGDGSLSGSLNDGELGWTLPSEASGSIEWLIIPFSEAAPESDRSYDVGGTLRYSLDGENITIPLLPTLITVTPDPSLLVHYFWERFVVGDDPFTDVVEESVPFTLGVAVKNAGHGVASSLRITSGQPEIIENNKGLAVNFMLTGAMIGNGSIEPSLTVTFGDVPPDTTKVARWQIISSLQGEFKNYSATFENINPLGDPNLSILDELEIHELIRNVRVYNSSEDDGVLDFLVNQLNDLDGFPDALYSSKTLKRYNVSVGTILSVRNITTTLLEVKTLTNTTGWVYYRYEDTQEILQSTALTVNVSKHVNNQTTSLPPENAWITRHKNISESNETFYYHIVDNVTTLNEITFIMDLCSSDCHSTETKFTRATTAPTVTFNQSTYNVDEDDGSAQPVLVLSNPSSTDITISVFNTDGSATGTDYSSGPYNVTIPGGQISVPFDVPINDDDVFEENEQFFLTIDQSSSLNGVIIGSPNVAVVNISESSPVISSVNFTQSKYDVDEDDGTAQPVLVVSNPSSTDTIVTVFSRSRSATGDVDYNSGPYNVTIPAGQISVPFDVPINDDNEPEKKETFLLKITNSLSLNGVIIGSPNVAVVKIIDNDCNPCVVDNTTKTVDENNVMITFSSDDPTATFKCKLDKGEFEVCASPMMYTNLLTGKHRITVLAICSIKCGRANRRRLRLKVV